MFFLIGFSLIFPVFAQDVTDSTISTNMTDSTQNGSENISWNVGIFAIIGSAITFIGILLTIRFVYIDKRHEERIESIRDDIESELENQEKLVDKNLFLKDNVRWIADYISSLHIALADVKRRRKGNNQNGILIDIFCMGSLFITGAFATTGFFADNFPILLIIIGIVAFSPVTHFVIQLTRIKYKFKFNHSQ